MPASHRRSWIAIALVAWVVCPPTARAQDLTPQRIFGAGEFLPDGLPNMRWMPDGARMSFVAPAADGATDIVAMDVRTGRQERLADGTALVPGGERRPIRVEGYDWSPDGRKVLIFTRSERVWRANTKGVYFVYDLLSGELQPISTAFGFQMFAKFSPDGTRVGFVRENDLFVTDLETGQERRLTRDGSDMVVNGTFDWVYEEELGLQDGWRWSPDGRRIAFWQLDQTPIRTFYLIDDLDTYSRPVPIPYPKAGAPNSFARIGVVELESGATTWMDTGDNPDVYLARMEWAAASDELLIQRLNRHQNRLDVLLASTGDGSTRILFSETSDTWIDVDNDLTWIDQGRSFLWTSERDGFNHIYVYARDGALERQLTRGTWEVVAPLGMDAQGRVYFSAAKESPLERHLYRVPRSGGDPELLTNEDGTHQVNVGPGARYFIDTHSSAGHPPVVALRDADGAVVRQLVGNERLRASLAATGITPPEMFTVDTRDGTTLNGWMIKPPDFREDRQYPVIMFVYGGPGSQRVVDAWGGSRYLWHELLAREGFVVVSVDNRGTGGRGKAFESIGYQRLGTYEVQDQVDVARYLAGQAWVDEARIGMWGWSYGGYTTLMTMAAGGGVIAAGVAVAPVTDWRNYDTIYTERFMRTPRENPEGYRTGSPTALAADFRGELLLVHGTGDDNVHFQNSVQFVDAMQAAGKQFQLMIYPNKTHSIAGPGTQTHLYTMMLDFWRETLGTP